MLKLAKGCYFLHIILILFRGFVRNNEPNDRSNEYYGSLKIIVSDLPENIIWKDFKELFSEDSEPIHADLRGNGIGVVEYASNEDVVRVIERLNGAIVNGSTIDIKRSDSPPPVPIRKERNRSRSFNRDRPPPRMSRDDERRRGRSRSRSREKDSYYSTHEPRYERRRSRSR